MRRFATSSLLFVLALTAGGEALHAQEVEQQQLDTIQQQIESGKAAEARIAQDIAAAIEEQDSVAERLGAIAAEIQSQEALVSGSEAEMKKLAAERAQLLAELGEKEDTLSALLAGLQRLEQNPPPALVVEPGDILSALRGAMLLGTLAPSLKAEADALALKLDQLAQVEATLKTKRQDVAAEIARLEQQRVELGRLVAQKKALVSKSSADLEAERKRTRSLAEKAKSLKQLLASLAEERKRQEQAAAAQLAAEELERKRQEELQRAPRPGFRPGQGKAQLSGTRPDRPPLWRA